MCCYNGEPFQFGSTITVVASADNCVTTSLECGEEGIKTRIDIRREETGCSGPATHEQVRQIKCMLKQHLAESGAFVYKSSRWSKTGLKANMCFLLTKCKCYFNMTIDSAQHLISLFSPPLNSFSFFYSGPRRY